MYKPLYIGQYKEGLNQSSPESVLTDDAFPISFNMYTWRERIVQKTGARKLGRLRRKFVDTSIGNSTAVQWDFNLFAVVTPAITETLKQLEPGSVTITIGATEFEDDGFGNLDGPDASNFGTVNYATGDIEITHNKGVAASTATFNYFPSLPVMGIIVKEGEQINQNSTIIFDTTYAYQYSADGYQEYITGTTWTGTDSDFFWGTNFWQTASGTAKYLFVTNFSGTLGDPMRYTDGVTWTTFNPLITATDRLTQARMLMPFRGRLIALNTYEGTSLATSVNYPQRIRWAQIGNPIGTDSWRQDPPFTGGYIDIPTAQDIVGAGYVRDNLVIFCERSTWQLRYTGQYIQPFIVEKINTELGSESTFSVIPMEKSNLAMGQTGINHCDSFSSERIDIKIPDLVFNIQNDNEGTERVYGLRDYIKRIAFWTYPVTEDTSLPVTYPNRRLIYNYENQSWGIFYDSYTALGTYQPATDQTWETDDRWDNIEYSWEGNPAFIPRPIGGNQLGFVMELDTEVALNQPSLTITDIESDGVNPTKLVIPDHNLADNMIITIRGIPLGTDYANLNSPLSGLITAITQDDPAQVTAVDHGLSTGDRVNINGVNGMTEVNGLLAFITVVDADNFTLDGINSTTYTAYTDSGSWSLIIPNCFRASIDVSEPTKISLFKYSPLSGQFTDPQLNDSGTYIGGGEVAIRDNFYVQSKKFNFLDIGESIRLSHIDLLAQSSSEGEMTILTFNDYVNSPSNTYPNNVVPATGEEDPLFNTKVQLNASAQGQFAMQRVECPTYGAFISFAWTFSPEQMATNKSETNILIEGHIVWLRKSGKQLNRI